MGDQPQRDVKKAELSLLKLVFPRTMESMKNAGYAQFQKVHIVSLHIGPLDDFFLRSLPYTLVDASEMSIHL